MKVVEALYLCITGERDRILNSCIVRKKGSSLVALAVIVYMSRAGLGWTADGTVDAFFDTCTITDHHEPASTSSVTR